MEEVVATRLKKQQLDIIDNLVKRGVFASRSQAIRDLISKGIDITLSNDPIQNELLLGKSHLDADTLFGISSKIFDKPIADLVREMRE